MCYKKQIKYNISGIKRAPCLKRFNNKNTCFCNYVCSDALCQIHVNKNTKSNNKIFNEINPIDYARVKKEKFRIILLLESPHQNEYKKGIVEKNDSKIGLPARGSTCIGLNNYFCSDILPQIRNYMEDNIDYEIVLMNPIQFQVSLGLNLQYKNKPIKKHIVVRDYNWKRMWYSSCNDFERRLKRIVAKNLIILNLCTCNSNIINKHQVVSEVILKKFPSVTLFEGKHPSCWHYHKANTKLYLVKHGDLCVELCKC